MEGCEERENEGRKRERERERVAREVRMFVGSRETGTATGKRSYVSQRKHDPAVKPGCWGYI